MWNRVSYKALHAFLRASKHAHVNGAGQVHLQQAKCFASERIASVRGSRLAVLLPFQIRSLIIIIIVIMFTFMCHFSTIAKHMARLC